MLTLKDLISRAAQDGHLDWIGIRPERRAPMLEPAVAVLLTQCGLEGDRSSHRRGGARQVTLIQREHLSSIASFLGRDVIAPSQLRRNLLVSGINVLSLRRATFAIGDAVLEGTGHCHPCSRLEETLGHGGYNAVRGLAGITARVIQGAAIAVGDPVRLLEGQMEGGS